MNSLTLYFEYIDDTDTFRVTCTGYDDGYGMDLIDALQHFVEMNEDAWNMIQDHMPMPATAPGVADGKE